MLLDYVEQLTTAGYCRIPQVFSADEAAEALERVKYWHAHTKNKLADTIPFLDTEQPTLYNLQNKDFFFLDMLFRPTILQDVLMHFLNDQWYRQIPQREPNYILRSFIGRSSNTQLPMHIDSFVPYGGAHVFVMQCSIILEDQSAENGSTVVVPGSHLYERYADQDSFYDAVPITSQAGDIVLWDSRLWHGTTANQTGGTRWAMIATFARWWLKQHFNVTGNLPQDIYAQLSDSQKAVLGFCSAPHNDETEGIDMKRGYSELPAHVDAYLPARARPVLA